MFNAVFMYILEIQATSLKLNCVPTVLKIEFVVKMYGDMSILSQGTVEVKQYFEEMEFGTSPLLLNGTDSQLFTDQLFDPRTQMFTNFKLMNSLTNIPRTQSSLRPREKSENTTVSQFLRLNLRFSRHIKNTSLRFVFWFLSCFVIILPH